MSPHPQIYSSQTSNTRKSEFILCALQSPKFLTPLEGSEAFCSHVSTKNNDAGKISTRLHLFAWHVQKLKYIKYVGKAGSGLK